MPEPLIIPLPARIDLVAAQDIVARVRSALRNGKIRIALQFAPNSNLCSSEFLAYLVTVGKHVREANGSLDLLGLSEENLRIITMLRLDRHMGIPLGTPAVPEPIGQGPVPREAP